jgi:hypothetical protein
MKKSLTLAAAVAAIAVPGAASALNVPAYNVDGGAVPMTTPVGNVGFVDSTLALGQAGPGLCRYRIAWRDPFNPNNALNCDLLELRGTLNPSCNTNKTVNFATSVVAGIGSACGGFDNTGTAFPAGVVLILSESAGGGVGALDGTVIYPLGAGVIILPIEF